MARHFIREWRKHRRLTQDKLSQLMGVGRTRVTQIETGYREYDQDFLENAANALSCSPADLIARAPGDRESLDLLLGQVDNSTRDRIVAAVKALLPMSDNSSSSR